MSDIPVIVAPVTVIPPLDMPTSTDAKATAMPVTTAEEDRRTRGQRTINAIWESTQATIAISVAGATLWVAAHLALRIDAGDASMLLLSNAFFLVIGFYFGRTNHQRIGGVQTGR